MVLCQPIHLAKELSVKIWLKAMPSNVWWLYRRSCFQTHKFPHVCGFCRAIKSQVLMAVLIELIRYCLLMLGIQLLEEYQEHKLNLMIVMLRKYPSFITAGEEQSLVMESPMKIFPR